jgi:hypothetical protein
MATAAELEQIRLLVADLDADNPVFTDAHYELFLELSDGTVKKAAAVALRTCAVDVAQQAGPLRALLDVELGGRDSAAILNARADQLDAEATVDSGGSTMRSVWLSAFDADEDTASEVV